MSFLGRHTARSEPRQIVDNIRETMDWWQEDVLRLKTWDSYLTDLTRRAERIGVIVLRSGVVGNNTHRPISTEILRGFALYDSYAPIIFINARDAIAARIFTFAHEIAHIWIGESGISKIEEEQTARGRDSEIEFFCNQIASELLMPENEFRKQFQEYTVETSTFQHLAKSFRVSSIAALVRAKSLNLITLEEYNQVADPIRKSQQKPRPHSGGDYFNNVMARHSNLFTQTLLGAAMENRVTLRDAARMLDVSIEGIFSLDARIHGRSNT